MKTVEKLVGGAATIILVGIMILYMGYVDGQWNEMAVGAVIIVGTFAALVYHFTWSEYKDEGAGPDEWTLQAFIKHVESIYAEAKESALKTSEYMERAKGIIHQSARLHGIEEDEVDFLIAGLQSIADAEDETRKE